MLNDERSKSRVTQFYPLELCLARRQSTKPIVKEKMICWLSQMKRSTLPVWSPQTREKGQQNQESSQLDQRDKSTKSVQGTVINKTVSNQGSKGVNTIQGKTANMTNMTNDSVISRESEFEVYFNLNSYLYIIYILYINMFNIRDF